MHGTVLADWLSLSAAGAGYLNGTAHQTGFILGSPEVTVVLHVLLTFHLASDVFQKD